MKDGKTEVQTSCSTCCKPCAPFQTPKLQDVNAMQSTGSCLKLCLLKCISQIQFKHKPKKTHFKYNQKKKKYKQAGRVQILTIRTLYTTPPHTDSDTESSTEAMGVTLGGVKM